MLYNIGLMVKIDILNMKGEKTGKISLPKEIFAAKINESLMAQAVRVYLANQRQGTVSSKTRGEVRGSRRKIWRQKGTGRARHGDAYAPIFVGGGVAHGPKPKDWSLKLSKKMRRIALFSALTSKLQDKAIIIVEGLEKIKPKSKEMLKVISNLKFQVSKQKLEDKILLVLPETIDELVRAGRNIENLDLRPANLLNTYEVLNHEKVVLVKEVIPVLKRIFLKPNG